MKSQRSLYLLPFVLLALAACAVNPHKTAQSVEQQADATYGDLVILKEQGAAILKDATVSDTVKRPIAQLIVKSKPVTDNLQSSIVLYTRVKADVASGASTEERLAVVNRELAGWIVAGELGHRMHVFLVFGRRIVGA